MIKRKIYGKLLVWKNKKKRKPLILKGARQVGKSFIVKEFGKNEFKNIFEINFQENKEFLEIFEKDLTPKNILVKLEILFNQNIDIENDLIFFDEIQEAPKALTSLKYFCEKMPEIAIIGAGSYLGLLKEEESFPVGKVDFLTMFPIQFEEFLEAKDTRLFEFYNNIELKNLEQIDDFFHKKLLEILNIYFLIGGMPEVIQEYLDLGLNLESFIEIRKIQKNILESYERDFIKYSGVLNTTNILEVYNNIAYQLQKVYDESTNRFKFSGVISGKKSFNDFAGYLTFLSKSRLIIKNYIVEIARKPLKAYIKNNIFKVFYHDIGLLNAKLGVGLNDFINKEIGEYKGFIVENFVAMELFNKFDNDLISWKSRNSEIEFLIEKEDKIIPIEIKSSTRYRQAKSLGVYIEKNNPELAYKITMENFYKKEKFINLPMYLIGKI